MAANHWNSLPALPETMQPEDLPMQSVAMVPAAAADALIEATRKSLHREIELLREMIKEIESQAERRVQTLEEQARADRETIIDLNRRLAEAEQLARLYEAGRLKSISE
jgi:hypothetical protein